MSGEGGWVVVLWAWVEVCVEKMGDGRLATHIGGCFVEYGGVIGVVTSGVYRPGW